MPDSKIYYDDIELPKKVSDILQLDFWTLQHVPTAMVRTVCNPVKFSATTSIFVHSGECEADINLLTYKIKGPCVVNIAAGDIVLPKAVSDNLDASFMVCSKRLSDAISAHINDLGIFSIMRSSPVVNISDDDKIKMENFYNEMHQITVDKDNEHPFESVLYSIIAFFYRHAIKYYDRRDTNLPQNINNRIADRFLMLVQEHFKKERFLDFYADRLDITPKHLSRTVKTQTGYSAVEWINRFIILEAKVMLRSSNLNIQQISEELSFPSQSFFGKYFKKATGLSPKDYRNSF